MDTGLAGGGLPVFVLEVDAKLLIPLWDLLPVSQRIFFSVSRTWEICCETIDIIEGSLNSKLPTIWRVEKQR